MKRKDAAAAVDEPRCAWTNRRDAGTREVVLEEAGGEPCFVCPRHEALVRAYHARVRRLRGVFLGVLAAVVVGLVLASVLESAVGAGAVLIAGGIGIFLLPFATPETVRMHGIRASIRTARALSLLVILLGVAELAAALG